MSADFPRSVSSSFRRGATVACAIYLVWAAFLLFGPSSGAPADGTNLVPLHTIRSQLDRQVYGQLIGNLLLLAPPAIVLRWWRWSMAAVLFSLVGVSAAVEVGQAVVGRISDVDDVILNVAGGLIAAGVASFVRPPSTSETAAAPPSPNHPTTESARR